MTEAQVQHAILLKYGAHPRIRIARINTGAALVRGRLVKFGVPGTADIVGLIAPSGRFLAIEVKSATGRQSYDQKRFERVITAMGGVYVLARSVADVDAVLGRLVDPIPDSP